MLSGKKLHIRANQLLNNSTGYSVIIVDFPSNSMMYENLQNSINSECTILSTLNGGLGSLLTDQQ